MLDWLADRANVVLFLLAALAIIFLYAWWTTRRAKFWRGAAAVFGVMLLVWLLTKFVVTDRQQIVRNLDAMATAVEKHDADGLFKHVSKDFRFGASNREELHKRIAASIRAHKVSAISLSSKSVTVKGDSAEAMFSFRAEGDLGVFPASAKATFVREGGAWKLRTANLPHRHARPATAAGILAAFPFFQGPPANAGN